MTVVCVPRCLKEEKCTSGVLMLSHMLALTSQGLGQAAVHIR